MAITTAPPLIAVAVPEVRGPLFMDVLRSEWTKLRTVRSTWRTLLAAAVLIVGLGIVICAVYVGKYDKVSAADKANFDPTSFSLAGLLMGQLAIGVLGVLLITNEYSTGMIRTTFAAVPQRRLVLAAKAGAFTAVTLVVGTASSFVAFLVGQAILSRQGIGTSLADPTVLRAVIGAGLYLTVFGLLGLGLGTIIRHTAGGIATLFGLIFVLPGLAAALPSSRATASPRIFPATRAG